MVAIGEVRFLSCMMSSVCEPRSVRGPVPVWAGSRPLSEAGMGAGVLWRVLGYCAGGRFGSKRRPLRRRGGRRISSFI